MKGEKLTREKPLTKAEKIKALMAGFGLSRKEAIAELEDMGE